MNYFIKGLISGNWKYWAYIGVMVIWLVAVIDIFSTAVNPPGLFNGTWFNVTLIMTFVGPVLYYVFDLLVRTKRGKKIKTVEAKAAWFEPQREKAIRRMVERDPEFVTLCYQCIHFDSHLLACAKQFSNDVAYQRVKEITINNRKYCLYWEDASRSRHAQSHGR